MELLEAATLLHGFIRLGLESAGELLDMRVDHACGLTFRIGRLGDSRTQVASDGVARDAELLGNFSDLDLVPEISAASVPDRS